MMKRILFILVILFLISCGSSPPTQTPIENVFITPPNIDILGTYELIGFTQAHIYEPWDGNMIITQDKMTITICKLSSCSIWDGYYEFKDNGILLVEDPPDANFTYEFRIDYPMSFFILSDYGYYYENWMKIAD